ncbi:MAG TPA: ring-cleaving dioxygenase [Gemmatimonadales bacterium]|nr:ring-cleaving dioxygenase [Gemmatimonadales bacterium]
MAHSVLGIHHVTAIAGDPQRNLDFYAGVLGLRLVKRTVNQDDPFTYHLYYGDGLGRPGSILTFFPWNDLPRGRAGAGQATAVAFAIGAESLGFWIERLLRHGIAYRRPTRRFGENVLAFSDPDGLGLELVAAARPGPYEPWEDSGVPPEHAIRGLHGVTLLEQDPAVARALLTATLGFREVDRHDGRIRLEAGAGGPSTFVDVQAAPDFWSGRLGVGTVHHVAWRLPDDAAQREMRDRVVDAGRAPTDVIDRFYFRSVYFREPGGVLFELATDPPGFTVDEPPESLGTRLVLPPWLEPERATIERHLPPLRLPAPARAGA